MNEGFSGVCHVMWSLEKLCLCCCASNARNISHSIFTVKFVCAVENAPADPGSVGATTSRSCVGARTGKKNCGLLCAKHGGESILFSHDSGGTWALWPCSGICQWKGCDVCHGGPKELTDGHSVTSAADSSMVPLPLKSQDLSMGMLQSYCRRRLKSKQETLLLFAALVPPGSDPGQDLVTTHTTHTHTTHTHTHTHKHTHTHTDTASPLPQHASSVNPAHFSELCSIDRSKLRAEKLPPNQLPARQHTPEAETLSVLCFLLTGSDPGAGEEQRPPTGILKNG